MGVELKPTMPPQQMMDSALRHGPYGDKSERKLSPAALEDYPHGLDPAAQAESGARRLKTPNKRIQAAPALMLDDLRVSPRNLRRVPTSCC